MRVNRILSVTGDYTHKEMCQQAAARMNYRIDYTQTMDEALNMLLDWDYVLVVIRADTVDYLTKLRIMKRLKPMPILVLSYTESIDRITPMKMGADSYIDTPFDLDYIIEISLKLIKFYEYTHGSHSSKAPDYLTYEHLHICVDSRQVFVKGDLVDMTPKEFNVLCLLMRNEGDVLTYREIYKNVWGDEYTDNPNNVLSCVIRRINRKLISIEPSTKGYIKNKYQVGYSFDPS